MSMIVRYISNEIRVYTGWDDGPAGEVQEFLTCVRACVRWCACVRVFAGLHNGQEHNESLEQVHT
jgi:hypothetical protein